MTNTDLQPDDHDDVEILTIDAQDNEHRVLDAIQADDAEYADFEILSVDESGDPDEKFVRVRWLHPDEVDKPLAPSEVELPEGVEYRNVKFDDDAPEVLATVPWGENEWGEAEYRQFNPQNGRWYSRDPFPDIRHTTVHGGLEVNCAYSDCSGRTDVQVQGDFDRKRCPDCGESAMGRGQFSDDAQDRRRTRSHVAAKTTELRDEFAKEMQRLTNHGVGPAAAMDYLMCSVGDTPAKEWAEARDVRERQVKRNMKRVSKKLGEKVTYSVRGGGA